MIAFFSKLYLSKLAQTFLSRLHHECAILFQPLMVSLWAVTSPDTMEPLAVSSSALQTPPPGSAHHPLHRLHQAWGFPQQTAPGSPPTPAATPGSYEASVVATALREATSWAHHPMLATPTAQQHQQHWNKVRFDVGITRVWKQQWAKID